VVRIAAPALVGLGVALRGVPAVFGAQLVLYLGVLVALLPVTAGRHDVRSVTQQSPLQNLSEGLRYAAGQPVVWINLALSLAVYLVGPDLFFFVLPVYVGEALHLGAEGVGLLGSASAVSGILGGLAAPELGRWAGHGTLLAATLAGMAAAMLGLSVVTWVPATLLCAAVMGGSLIAFRALNEAAIQQAIAPAYRGRVSSLSAMMMGAGVFTGLLAGGVSQFAGAPTAIGGGGVALLVVGAAMAVRRPFALAGVAPQPVNKEQPAI